MDEADSVEALQSLGLTGYEAKVFVALVRLGVATAREVHRAADVPRSQVYGAAEALEDRGLVEVKQSSPLQYRAVPLSEARARLAERQERTRERAFDYLESVREEGGRGTERQEDIWTVRGRDAVDRRLRRLAAEADDRVLAGFTAPSLLPADTVEALVARARDGVAVTVVSDDPAVRERFADGPVATTPPPADRPPAEHTGRLLAADGDTLLLSVLGADGAAEMAVWSQSTGFAAALLQLVDAWLGDAASV